MDLVYQAVWNPREALSLVFVGTLFCSFFCSSSVLVLSAYGADEVAAML